MSNVVGLRVYRSIKWANWRWIKYDQKGIGIRWDCCSSPKKKENIKLLGSANAIVSYIFLHCRLVEKIIVQVSNAWKQKKSSDIDGGSSPSTLETHSLSRRRPSSHLNMKSWQVQELVRDDNSCTAVDRRSSRLSDVACSQKKCWMKIEIALCAGCERDRRRERENRPKKKFIQLLVLSLHFSLSRFLLHNNQNQICNKLFAMSIMFWKLLLRNRSPFE